MSELKTSIVVSLVDRMSGPVRRLRAQAERLQATIGDVKRFRVAHRAMLEHKRDLQSAQERTRELARAMRASGGGTKAQARAFEQARRKAVELKQTIQSEQQSLEVLRRKLHAAGVNTHNLAAEQARLERRLARVTKSVQLAGRGMSGMAHVGRSAWKVMRYGAGVMGIVNGAVTALAGGMNRVLVRPAAQFEQFRAVLETIEGSSAKAKSSMDWIQDFAATTPYELEQVTGAFVKLRAYGLNPTDGLLKTLGDTAAAMGKPLDQAVEAIADATTGEYERLKEFGIKAFTQGNRTAFQYTDKNGMQMTKVVDNRNRAMIQSTLEAIWNEKYAGAMERQSKTWKGMMSNLGDWWTKFVNMVMDAGAFDAMKEKLASVLQTVRQMAASGELAARAREISEAVVRTVNAMWAVGKATVAVYRVVAGVVRGVVRVIDVLTTPIQWVFEKIQKISEFLFSGNAIGNFIGKSTAALLAGLGSSDAARALEINTRNEVLGSPAPTLMASRHLPAQKAEVGGVLKIEIAGAPARVRRLESHGGMGIDVATGPIPVGAP